MGGFGGNYGYGNFEGMSDRKIHWWSTTHGGGFEFFCFLFFFFSYSTFLKDAWDTFLCDVGIILMVVIDHVIESVNDSLTVMDERRMEKFSEHHETN